MRAAQRPLTGGWVAGGVRARHLLLRRLGRDRALQVAAAPSLQDAIGLLAGTAYGRAVEPGMDLPATRRALAATALWHLRVLAGWTPPRAVATIRALAAWFELANVDDLARRLLGGPFHPPFDLGGLASAWPRLAGARGLPELRRELAASVWGDPGTDDPALMAVALRLSWGARVLDAVEEAEAWVCGAVALLLARELLLVGRRPPELLARRVPGVGAGWTDAHDLQALREALPARAAWALAGVTEPRELWAAEAAWWRRVEADGEELARSALLGRPAVVGSIVLLAVDAWRTAAALEVAARGGGGVAMAAFERLA